MGQTTQFREKGVILDAGRVIIECQLCPCRFLTERDLQYHMVGFGNDSKKHINIFLGNLKSSSSISKTEFMIYKKELFWLYLQNTAEERAIIKDRWKRALLDYYAED